MDSILLLTNLGWLPGVFTTGESQLPGDEYTGESRRWIHRGVDYKLE
jgi:hypothetical protein